MAAQYFILRIYHKELFATINYNSINILEVFKPSMGHMARPAPPPKKRKKRLDKQAGSVAQW
jgi:hypothetical protein